MINLLLKVLRSNSKKFWITEFFFLKKKLLIISKDVNIKSNNLSIFFLIVCIVLNQPVAVHGDNNYLNLFFFS